MKILIIEDTKEVSDLLEALLARWGHQSRTVSTGKEAISRLKEEIFDLALVDIFLPDMMAYDLIPIIRAAWSGTHIVTMTGQNSRELEEKVRSKGILYYMVKPIIYSELKAIIDHLVKIRDNRYQLGDSSWIKDIDNYY